MGQYLSPGVYVEEVPPLSRPIAGVGTSTPGFVGVIPDQLVLPARPAMTDSDVLKARGYKLVTRSVAAEVKRPYHVTSWNQYVRLFGDLIGDPADDASADAMPSSDTGQRNLAHAVYGFFNNGGASCYVIRISAAEDLRAALSAFAAIDDITIVAAPGFATAAAYAELIAHCELLKDRVAVLDSVASDPTFDDGDFSKLQTPGTSSGAGRPPNSTYAAFYFPWVKVFDPATSLLQSANRGDGLIDVPPSGHVAGVYARSDTARGVFKAPANEALQGVIGLRYALSKPDQDQLNDDGVNLIRTLVGAIRVWGARTVGGDANGEYRYISTRRYFNYLRESIDQGTQFVVFEPNTDALWQRIKRSVGGFLLNEWRQGALFGATPDKAFYVKCDADTNPAEVREAGQVVTEIGVAIVKPAEFVIFRIQQLAGA